MITKDYQHTAQVRRDNDGDITVSATIYEATYQNDKIFAVKRYVIVNTNIASSDAPLGSFPRDRCGIPTPLDECLAAITNKWREDTATVVAEITQNTEISSHSLLRRMI